MSEMLELPAIGISDTIQIKEIIAVTARLKQVLKQESEFLRQMQIRKAGTLQDEKNKLISWLEAQKKIIALNPQMKHGMHEDDHQAMSDLVDDFSKVVEENYHQASIAKAVNERVVQAVTDAMQARANVNIYNANGTTSRANQVQGLPFNINQKA